VRFSELRSRAAARRAATRAADADETGEQKPETGFLLPPAAAEVRARPAAAAAGHRAVDRSTIDSSSNEPAAAEAAAARAALVRARLAASSASSASVSVSVSPVPPPPDAGGALGVAGGGVKKLRRKVKKSSAGHFRSVRADELLPLDEPPPSNPDSNPGSNAGQKEEDAWGRFQAAKARAAEQSAARIGTFEQNILPRASLAAPPAYEDGDAEEDKQLEAAIERARRVASGPRDRSAQIAASVSARRAADAGDGLGGEGAMSSAAEFVRSLGVERSKARAEPAGGGAHLEEGPARRQYRSRTADAVAAEAEDAAAPPAAVEIEQPAAETFDPEEAEHAQRGVGEILAAAPSAGRGLAATLALLKEKGTLTEGVTWAGRNTDKKPQALAGAMEAAAIGTDDADWSFGFTIDRLDEFGRKMTPKEAFRELCHKFHGIFPSRGKQEARLKQWQQEQAALKAAEGETPLQAVAKMREATAKTATPFVVLSGSVKSAQVTDAKSHFATAEREAPRAEAREKGRLPLLQEPARVAGGMAPLEGAAKVRFLLGRGEEKEAKKARRE
jgi:hypothetical protein